MTEFITTLNLIILLMALSQAGSPPPPRQQSLDSLERAIADRHRRDHISLDEDVAALLAVQLRTHWSR